MRGRFMGARSLALVGSAALVATTVVAVSPSASGAPGVQPRALGVQYGTWSAVGAGIDDSQVYTLMKSDALGLVATGTFRASGGVQVNRVAQLLQGTAGASSIDDTGFDSSVGSQYTDPVKPGVYGAALSPDDTIYAAGYFGRAGDDTAINVARWTGSEWSGMGLGLFSPLGDTDAVLENIVIGLDDTDYADDTVYAIGEFTGICTNATCSSTTSVSGFAQWHDDTWYPMGSGATNGKVFAGAFADDTLYVGGRFTQIQGRNVTRLAAWRESDDTWVSVGNWSPDQQVAALTVHPVTGDLYAAGYFDDIGGGGSRLSGVARYSVTDDTWYGVGNFTGNVDIAALDFDPSGNHLYVSGGFNNATTTAGSTIFNGVAKLGGSFTFPSSTTPGAVGGEWLPLQSYDGLIGVQSSKRVRTVVANADGTAYFGGDFTQAGSVVSAKRVALFTPGPAPDPYAPVYPPGAPTDVKATGKWKTVQVNWKAPTYTGSYPITNYLVTASPGGQVCITRLTDPDLTECTYRSLTPGVQYTFTVQGLNGGGWGERSAASNPATPQDIRITSNTRKKNNFFQGGGSTVTASGVAPGFPAGTQMSPWLMWNNSGTWEKVTGGGPKVGADGKFSWQRKFSKQQNSRVLSVKFTIGDANESNTATYGPVR